MKTDDKEKHNLVFPNEKKEISIGHLRDVFLQLANRYGRDVLLTYLKEQ